MSGHVDFCPRPGAEEKITNNFKIGLFLLKGEMGSTKSFT